MVSLPFYKSQNIQPMSRAKKRKITILNEVYFWILDGNTIDTPKPCHIRIYSKKLTKSILYIDPYNWHFEIRPRTIGRAILFAIEQGWNPEEKGNEMYISMNNEEEFYQLAEGVKFGHLDENNVA